MTRDVINPRWLPYFQYLTPKVFLFSKISYPLHFYKTFSDGKYNLGYRDLTKHKYLIYLRIYHKKGRY